jgi:hypothetical protein
MAIYTFLRRDGDPAERAVVVREGFSLAAFALGVIWALWNRLWIVSALILVAMAAVALLASASGAPDTVATVLNLGLALILGFEGQSLRLWSLRRAGYVEDALVEARSREAAELTYFAAALPQRPQAGTGFRPVPHAGQGDPLGLFGNV